MAIRAYCSTCKTQRRELTCGHRPTAFYVEFRDQSGRRRKEWSGKTRRAAERRELQIRAEVRAGVYVHPSDRKRTLAAVETAATFGELLDRFDRDHVSRLRSGRMYPAIIKTLRAYFGADKPLTTFQPADFDAYARDRHSDVTVSTLRKELATVKLIFKLAVRWGLLERTPAEHIKPPRQTQGRVRFLTPDELTRLEQAAPPWLRSMVTFAAHTGLRLKELCNVRWDDIDGDMLTVSPDNKTGTLRHVPLNATARAVLASIPRRIRCPFVFTDAAGEPYQTQPTRHRVSRTTIAAMQAAEIAGASFHTLRHTAASWMVQAGVPLFTVGQVLGHRTPLTTQRYAHLQAGHLRAAVEVLDGAKQTQSTVTVAADAS